MIERDVETQLKRRIEQGIPGAKCLKFVSPGFTGVPDRLILLPGGNVVFVELKKPGEIPKQRQLFVQAQFRRLGFKVAGCVDSPEKVQEVVSLCRLIAGQYQGRSYQQAYSRKKRNAGSTGTVATQNADEGETGRHGGGDGE